MGGFKGWLAPVPTSHPLLHCPKGGDGMEGLSS